MRFGIFAGAMSAEPTQDGQVIESSLRESCLAEELGFDSVWLLEHNFDGSCAYADPLVFGAALATRTKRIRIGFAVVQMALHHPVRLAVQTSVLDNLSKGRLTVGTGRGSAYSHYEYIGFGVTMEQGWEMIEEAEELLVKAWSGDPVEHMGKFWQVSFPGLRPRPYQKPHPPVARACVNEQSVVAMAKRGKAILIGFQTPETLARYLNLYQETMLSAGFDEAAVEKALDQTWVQRSLYVADSDKEALEKATAGFERNQRHVREARAKYNPPIESATPAGSPAGTNGGDGHSRAGSGAQTKAPTITRVLEHNYVLGTPKKVAEQIAELKDAGIRNLMLQVNTGQMAFEEVSRTMHLFQEKVAPLFRN